MKMYNTKVDHLYSVKIDHRLWGDTIILTKPDNAGMYHIECVQGAREILGSQVVDKKCYLTDDGEFTLLGHKSKYPEYFL